MNDYDRVHLGQLSDQIATHRERTWFLQERVLQSGNRLDYAGALRHARAITAIAASEWMSTGLDPRPGMEFWGYGWEEDRTAIPAELSAVGKIG